MDAAIDGDQAASPCQTGFPGFGLPKVGATSHSAYLGSVVASGYIPPMRKKRIEGFII